MLSVICPIYNEGKYIYKCIESILAQDYPQDDLEILFVDGMSNDNTREIVTIYSRQYLFIHLLDNVHKIVPYAMNIGIAAAKGNVIMRLDAHTFYESNYLSSLTRRLFELDADNVGTVCKTDVLNKNPKALAICEVLSNKFGVGNSVFRTGIDEVQQVDTVPFGCWRRDAFKKYGQYDIRLVRNQDIEFNKRILRGGGKIFIIPDSFCTYLARETFGEILRNNYANGKWNILTVFYTRQFSSLSLRHFIPLLFLLSLIIPVCGSILYPPLILIFLLSLCSYVSLFSFISFKLAKEKKMSFGLLLWSFITLHLSYGWGALVGILKLPFLK